MALFRRAIESAGDTPGGEQERFPGFDVLGQVDTWDAVTAGVVLDRLGFPPALRYFTVAEQAVGTALFDQLLAQRKPPKIPVLELVDARLAENQTDGWRYDDMPEDGEAFRRTFAALDEDAMSAYDGRRFAGLDWGEQVDVIERMHDLGDGSWHGLTASRVWSLWIRYACATFYSHPWAWNEIGFGGPAYPRGYRNLGLDRREPWEVPDRVHRSPTGWGDRVEQARRGHAAGRQPEPTS